MVPSSEALLGPGTTAIRCPKKLQMTSLYPEKTQRIYKLPELIIQQGHQIQEPKLQGPWIVKGKRATAESIDPVQDHPHEHTHGCPSPQARMGGSEGRRGVGFLLV
ncbi:LOW QUALITY PROTEIN: TTLL9 isoform 3 [Pongo abelii]|uniref:TTLL9 isoform 2 n=1 Tax=Pongo abelii TaxID=9601 RepID=A0A2J8VIN6_PONAB|nr:LOW QUALITY PROTEIN: TTLL9 isoform 2 [Pongo abelii]PNJ57348.1 LOW QUALITY PROTEIN: TTLL9 isoform 3 [Pongo abelii]